MSVHYKFKSALDYDTVTFDGLHISVGDLKAAISQQKRIGKTSDFDLEITNAQTKEVYVDDHTLIPKNTSLLVARVPLSQQPKKQWEGSNSLTSTVHKDVAPNKGLADLSRMEGSEQDKINAMISQSTFDYDPSNYQKIRGQNQRGVIPPHYTCYKCQKRGHWIKDCPIAASADPVEIRRSTGIPRSFMVPVEGPKAPGAMMTPSGTFAVPAVDRDAYLASESAGGGGSEGAAPAAAAEAAVPDELICSLCRDLLTDAVMIPCCGNSFCDECIRGALLESEDHECPDCREKEIAPTTLIPNRFLRNSVSSFRNQTGYSRRMPHRAPAIPAQAPQPDPAAMHGPSPNGPIQHAMQNAPAAGPPHGVKHPGLDGPPLKIPPRIDEQRASTPTVDERRDPVAQPAYNRRPPPGFIPGVPPSTRPYNNAPPFGRPLVRPGGPFPERFPREPYQPPPPGIKDSPNGRSDDPLEAFNRMIREKEMRAKRREEERRRVQSGSRSPRSRSPRSPRSSRSPRSPRSPRAPRSPPRLVRSPRSPRSPRARPRSRANSRIRYSRSRSVSRGRVRRSPPWSPRRRRTRERTLSLTRSPSPRRRHRSPLRYRSPLRSPVRSPLRSPPRSLPRTPPRSPPRDLHRPPPRDVPPRDAPLRSLSPHRYAGVYDELLSPPPRRNVEPPYGPRYGPRNNGPPPNYPPMGTKVIPPLMPNIGIPPEPAPGYRGRYEGPPPFEDIPPGVEPPVPGFEPPPFEKPPFGPPGTMDRERLPPPSYRDPYGPRLPYGDVPGGFREMPILPISNEIPVHVGEPPRFRENYRPGPPSYREGPPPQFREGQSFREQGPQGPYRDPNYRGGPLVFREGPYRNVPFREPGFRDAPPHSSFRDGVPFRPPSTDPRDPREPVPPNYHDPNLRDGYRDDGSREHGRPGYRSSIRSRGGPRRNPILENDRHREREAHDRERYEAREAERTERSRDPEKRGREGRTRDNDRSRDVEKEKDHDRISPDKKSRGSPKRSKEGRDKRRSESRGRSRERDRDGRKEKKDERNRDKSLDERNKDHKEKEKKIKERKKKKREKEKDAEKKKKREKKEKKEKETIKKEEGNGDKTDDKIGKTEQTQPEPEHTEVQDQNNKLPNTEEITIKKEKSPKVEPESKPLDDLYGDEISEAVDKEILENYVKTDNEIETDQDTKVINDKKAEDASAKEEPFDGIELQVNAEELDLKPEPEHANKEMLAPLPELSKWEVDEENTEKSKEPGEISSPEEEEDGGKVTSDVIKRAENAIFAKAINSLRPIEIKKISSDRLKLYSDENTKTSMNNIQITVPVTDLDQRSIEIQEKKKRYSKTPPPRLSVKERLGGKVEDPKRGREPRVVHSTVERVKSRSKTPKKDQPYRRVTVEKERGRKQDPGGRSELSKGERRVASETIKVHGKHSGRSPREKKESDKYHKDDKRSNENISSRSHDKNAPSVVKSDTDRERKKSTLDEAHFEPDYDENVESENEIKDESSKKRERSVSPAGNDPKKTKVENETIKLDLANVKKKPDTETDSTSDSDESSSSSSGDVRKRNKKKKKRSKKKKKRAASDSESESDSSSDDHKKKKKKRKHKKKSSKKKSKKSKHK